MIQNSTKKKKFINYLIIKRKMHNSTKVVNQLLPKNIVAPGGSLRHMSIRRAFKFKKDAKSYATDDNTGHIMHTKVKCNDPTCATRDCKTPCGEVTQVEVDGHFSHSIPANKTGGVVNPTDINNDPVPQKFVKAQTKKTISKNTLKDLTEDDMHSHADGTTFASMPNVAALIDNITK
jgi:hypothetical protein